MRENFAVEAGEVIPNFPNTLFKAQEVFAGVPLARESAYMLVALPSLTRVSDQEKAGDLSPSL